MQLMRNDVYTIKGEREDTVRIIAFLYGQSVVVISVLKQDTLPYEIPISAFEQAIEDGRAERSVSFDTAYVPDPTPKQEAVADHIWGIIGNFVMDEPDCYDKKIRSRFITTKAKEMGIQRKQVQRYLYRYWAGGMMRHALYPNYELRGGPGKTRTNTRAGRPTIHKTSNERVVIGDRELSFIQEAIKKNYNKHTKYSYRYAYQSMIRAHYTDPVTGMVMEAIPTEAQFRYHGEKFVNEKQRFGSTVYNKDRRGITGSSRSEAIGPGDAYQIDATIADVYLVSELNRHAIVGRPELYFVVDVFSHMITGFYTCLESASWENARMALLIAFSDKVAYCAKYGVTIQDSDWPCVGLPRALIVDNGELVSKASNTLIANLGIEVKNEPAWRPDLKGIVESRFRLLNIREKAKLPGAVLPDFQQRGSEDYRLDAKLTLHEFTQIIIHFVLNHNKRQMNDHPQNHPDIIRDHVPAIPIELWRWGLHHRTGALRQMNPDDLKIALSERAQASVTESGILFHGLYYECETAMAENWFSRARTQGRWKVNVAYHPHDLDRIAYLKEQREYEWCVRTKDNMSLFAGMSIEEIDWQFGKQKDQKAEYTDITLQHDIDHDIAVDRIIARAEEEAKVTSITAGKMNLKPKEIRKNRKAEAEHLRAKEKEKNVPDDYERRSQKDQTKRSEQHADESRYSSIFAKYDDEDDDE